MIFDDLNLLNFYELKNITSLGSSPATIAFQSLNLFKTFIIALQKISYPFAELSFPTNVIIFFFFMFWVLY